MLQKGDRYKITIESMGSKAEGVGRIDGCAVFVDGAIVGEKVDVRLTKVNKNFAVGSIVKILEHSENRVTPKCKYTNKCGGCDMQHIAYDSQVNIKTKKVYDALARIGGFREPLDEGLIIVNDTIGMEQPYNYRNKAQFPVGTSGETVAIGFYKERSHDVIPIETCIIQHKCIEKVLKLTKEYMLENNIAPYDAQAHTGIVRHIITRVGCSTNEVMVCIVINAKRLPHMDKLISKLQFIENIKSIAININTKKGTLVLGDRTNIVHGKKYITDYIGDIKFAISPVSFFQVNSVQAKVLYDIILDLMKRDLRSDDIVVDAYCGIGSISLYIASHVKKVIGIEIMPEDVENARHNAILNNVDNVEFILGKAEEAVLQLHNDRNVKADLILVDPPRKGCDTELLEAILEIKPRKVVYVSCDPATLARDLKILCNEHYHIEAVQPVDLFPMTHHVETVVLLSQEEEKK